MAGARRSFAEDAKISPSDLTALRSKEVTLPGMEGALLELADALSDRGTVSDELWRHLHEGLGTRGAVEAVFVGAQYVKVALMNNVLRVVPPLPPQ